uniref:C-type lectin domain-containing protein n=1 Tax=Poecilia latipinna TaxID=48699 RepID=A0A3B3TRS9_9TELE
MPLLPLFPLQKGTAFLKRDEDDDPHQKTYLAMNNEFPLVLIQMLLSCYHFSTDQFSWAESRRSCREAGAELVKVDSRELYHLTGKMKSFQDMFWIGLTDSAEEGRWVWMDGSDLSESVQFWSQNEPDNWTAENPAGENCVRMGMEGGRPMNNWYDKDCGAAQRRICQKRNSG